jgi:hypothetical protein
MLTKQVELLSQRLHKAFQITKYSVYTKHTNNSHFWLSLTYVPVHPVRTILIDTFMFITNSLYLTLTLYKNLPQIFSTFVL